MLLHLPQARHIHVAVLDIAKERGVTARCLKEVVVVFVVIGNFVILVVLV